MRVLEEPKQVRFRCPNCFCLFEADYGECEPYSAQLSDIDDPLTKTRIVKIKCKCPRCNAMCAPTKLIGFKIVPINS